MDDVITRAADAIEWLSERYRRQLPGNRDMEADHRAMVALANDLRFMGWQPIETAPRDGTPILVQSDQYQIPYVVFWSAPCIEFGPLPALPDGTVIQRDWLLACAEEPATPLYDPTHWMPLPKPPEAE